MSEDVHDDVFDEILQEAVGNLKADLMKVSQDELKKQLEMIAGFIRRIDKSPNDDWRSKFSIAMEGMDRLILEIRTLVSTRFDLLHDMQKLSKGVEQRGREVEGLKGLIRDFIATGHVSLPVTERVMREIHEKSKKEG